MLLVLLGLVAATAFLFISRMIVPGAVAAVSAAVVVRGLLHAAAQRGGGDHAVRRLRRHRARRRACAGTGPGTRARRSALRARNLNVEHAQGERQARQPDRDRRGRGLARRGHRAGALRRRGLRGTSCSVQSESALRHLASQLQLRRRRGARRHEVTLRAGADTVAERAAATNCSSASRSPACDRRGQAHPPRLRARDRRRHAAPPAGRGRDRARAPRSSWAR